jgi:two-component sensor histidine kinase
MIGDDRAFVLNVCGDCGSATNRMAESLGLIVTELVINSLKHAFNDSSKDARITVSYEVFGKDWKLVVVDNGIGKPDGCFAQPKSGLGTGIINALASQLDAQVVTVSASKAPSFRSRIPPSGRSRLRGNDSPRYSSSCIAGFSCKTALSSELLTSICPL